MALIRCGLSTMMTPTYLFVSVPERGFVALILMVLNPPAGYEFFLRRFSPQAGIRGIDTPARTGNGDVGPDGTLFQSPSGDSWL